MQMKKLKGGSLSSTVLCSGASTFVRKKISLFENREYGFVRWYSQVKKMQMLSAFFPNLFPKIHAISVTNDYAYYDMDYLEGFSDIKTLLCQGAISNYIMHKMHAAVWRAFDELHSIKLPVIPRAASLYYQEEVRQKFNDANAESTDFASFAKLQDFRFNGEQIFRMSQHFPALEKYFNSVELTSEEFTHGNPTLENMMYSVEEDRIVFIDLYHESIIDSKLLDFAQVLQDSRSHYGFINDRSDGISIDENKVTYSLEIPPSFYVFNTLFVNELKNRGYDMKLIDTLEATQFIRMLPFKAATGNDDMAKFFYVHACKLFQGILK